MRKVCEGVLKHLDNRESLRVVKDLNSSGGGNRETTILQNNKTITKLSNKHQQQHLQVTPITNQSLEIERDKTLNNNRFVY